MTFQNVILVQAVNNAILFNGIRCGIRQRNRKAKLVRIQDSIFSVTTTGLSTWDCCG